jgi:hypothetical protein
MLNKDDRELFMLGVKPQLVKEMGKGSEPTPAYLGTCLLNRIKD